MSIHQAGSIATILHTSGNTTERREVLATRKELQTGQARAEKSSELLPSLLQPEKFNDKKLDQLETESLIEAANNELSTLTTALSFSIDKDVNRFVVKLIDVNSQETLRQYPAEEMLEVYKALKQVNSLIMPEHDGPTGNRNTLGTDLNSGILLSSKA